MNRITIRFLCLLLVFGIDVVAVTAKSTSDHTEQKNVLLIRQVNEFFGPTNLYICQDAAKFVGREGDVIITCQKPTWKVILYTKSEKKGLESDLESWSHHGLGAMNSKKPLKNGTVSTTFDRILKIDCTQIVVKTEDKFWGGGNDSTIFRAAEKKQLTAVKFKCTKSIALSDEVKKFLGGLYNQPNLGGIPLELVDECSDKSTSTTYATAGITKVKVDSSFFAYPKGYKVAADKAELLIGKKEKQKVQDFINVLIDESGAGKNGVSVEMPHVKPER